MALQDVRYGTNLDLQGYQLISPRLEQRASDPGILNSGSLWYDTGTNEAKAYDGSNVRPLYADDDDFHSLAFHSAAANLDEILIADSASSFAYKRIDKQTFLAGLSTLTNVYYRIIAETGVANLDASGSDYVYISGDGSIIQTIGDITGANTLSVIFKNQSANRILAGPTSGGTAYPTFRALLTSDMPVGYNATSWDAAYTHSIFTGNPHGVTASSVGAEPALGNPGVNGYVLSSTVGGTRSWIAAGTGTSYTFASGLTEAAGTVDLGGALSAAVEFTGGGIYDFEIGTTGSKINSFNMYADNACVVYTDTTMTIGSTGTMTVQHNAGGKSLAFTIAATTLTDADSSIGFQYAGDYSTNGLALGARWIPDWAAVIAQLGGKNVSSLITTPTVTQDGYSITWDNSLGNYDLTAAGGTSFWTDNGTSLSPSEDLLEHTVGTKINVVDFDYGGGVLVGNYDAAFADVNGYLYADDTRLEIGNYNGGVQAIRLDTTTGIYIYDAVNNQGAYYLYDYSTAGKSLGARWIPDWGAVTTQLGGNDVTATITSPGVPENGKVITWDQSGSEYTLVAATSGTVTSITSGNGMQFTTLTSTGAITLGTPSTLTLNTTNGFPTAITHTHALSIADVTTGASGLAPATGGVGATYYLDATGSWSTPAGSGGVSVSGVPALYDVAIWENASTIRGSNVFTWNNVQLSIKRGTTSATPLLILNDTDAVGTINNLALAIAATARAMDISDTVFKVWDTGSTKIQMYGDGSMYLVDDLRIGVISQYISGYTKSITVAATGASEVVGLELVGNYTSNNSVATISFHNHSAAISTKLIASISVERHNNNNAGKFVFSGTNSSGTLMTFAEFSYSANVFYSSDIGIIYINSSGLMPVLPNTYGLGSDTNYFSNLFTSNIRLKSITGTSNRIVYADSNGDLNDSASLAGSGIRMVVCDSNGDLSAAAIPTASGTLDGTVAGVLLTYGSSTPRCTTGAEYLVATVPLTNAEYIGSADGTRVFEVRIGGRFDSTAARYASITVKLGTDTFGTINTHAHADASSYECVFRFTAISSSLSTISGHMISDTWSGNAESYATISGSPSTHGIGDDLKIYINTSASSGESPYVTVDVLVVEVFEV